MSVAKLSAENVGLYKLTDCKTNFEGLGWEWGGEEGDYTYRYTVTTRMTPALRWAAIGAILMFH